MPVRCSIASSPLRAVIAVLLPGVGRQRYDPRRRHQPWRKESAWSAAIVHGRPANNNGCSVTTSCVDSTCRCRGDPASLSPVTRMLLQDGCAATVSLDRCKRRSAGTGSPAAGPTSRCRVHALGDVRLIPPPGAIALALRPTAAKPHCRCSACGWQAAASGVR